MKERFGLTDCTGNAVMTVCGALVFVLTLGYGNAATVTVPATYATIQSALAATASGDVIEVADGTYYESFYVSGSRTFTASSGRPVIKFDGSHQVIPAWAGSGAMLSCAYGATVTFVGFELDGVNAAEDDTCNNLLWGQGTIILHDCVLNVSRGYLVRSNSLSEAHGCVFNGPAASGWYARRGLVDGCTFDGVTDGLYLYGTSDAYFTGNVFRNCSNAAVRARNTRDNTFSNNLVYSCLNGYYAAFTGSFDPAVRPVLLNNTIVHNGRNGVRISGQHGAVLTNNILFGNGTQDTAGYYDLYAAVSGKAGWDIGHNLVGRYSDSLVATFADSVACRGNITGDADPLFADTSDHVNGFYLLVNSPCIDAGDPGVRDPDSSRSDMGAYGGPAGNMKAPRWLRNLGSVIQTAGTPYDNLSWPQSDAPDFHSYRIYHDVTTTDMGYQPSVVNQVATVSTQAVTSGGYPHGADNTWYRVSVVGDSTGYLLGGGYSEMDTVGPVLQQAFYYSNGTADVTDDELRLVFSEGIRSGTFDAANPRNDIELLGQGDLTGAEAALENGLVIRMGASGTMPCRNRSWVKVAPGSGITDHYGNRAAAAGDSVPVITYNVFNTDSEISFATVKNAVEAAAAGDFISILDNGTYGPFSVTESRVTVQAHAAAVPVIDADGTTYCVTIAADSVSVVGLACTDAAGYGISVISGVTGARIIDNTCRSLVGVGISVPGGAAAATVRGNVCDGATVGIDCGAAGCLVADNVCLRGLDGITVLADDVTVRNNVLWDNTGGDVYAAGTRTRVTNCITDGSISGTAGNNSVISQVDAAGVFIDAGADDFRLVQSASQWGSGADGENIGVHEGRVTRSGDGHTYLYHTISAAYAAAGAAETLLVYPGRYYESLEVTAGKGVTVSAVPGTRPEIRWDGQGVLRDDVYYQVVSDAGAGLNLRGLVIDQGNANVPHDRVYYGNRRSGLVLTDAGRITGCVFRNAAVNAEPVENRVSLGIEGENGVTVDSSAFYHCGHITFTGCSSSGLKLVSDCVFDSSAAGIQLDGSNAVTVRRSSFGVGSRVYTDAGGRHTFINNVFNGASVTASADVNYDYDRPNVWRNNTIVNPAGGMTVQGVGDTLVNNIIRGTGGGTTALSMANGGGSVVAYYNLVSSTDIGAVNSHAWNIVGADPSFADSAAGDFHLAEHSRAIDGGDVRVCDPDGGRSDIGAYGGPAANTSAPVRLDSLKVRYGMFTDTLEWGGSVPDGDFSHYAVYSNRVSPNFAPGAADAEMTAADPASKTGYVAHPAGATAYYKVSVVDTDTYGGGYAGSDREPPHITEATYHSAGTADPADDYLLVLLSEWIVDPAVTAADSVLAVYGEGDFSGAAAGSGVRINDDTLVVTGISGMAARNRTWVGLRPGAVTDYAGNPCLPGSILVETRNVTIDGSLAEYATVAAAAAAAMPVQTVRVLDNGRYTGNTVINVPGLTVTADSGASVTLDGGGMTALTVTADNVRINGLRLTGGGDGLYGTGADLVVTNCIAHHNGGDGFDLNGTAALYNSNAYRNRAGAGVRIAAGGTCVNVVSSGNISNFILGTGVTHTANYSFNGAVGDQGYNLATNTSGTDPLYDNTDSTSAAFLIPSPSSECVNAGDSLAGIVDTDIRGRTRPQVNAWDAGAYETNYGGVWLHHFTAARTPATAAAGSPVTVTVTAYDQNGMVFTIYAQNTRITARSAQAGSLITYSGNITDNGDGTGDIAGTAFSGGSASFTVSYTLAYDSVTVRASDPEDSSGTSGSIMWYGSSLAAVEVNGVSYPDTIPGCMAGVTLPEDIEVRVFDAYGNRIREYTGSLTFFSGDSSMVLPAGVAFEAVDLGGKTVNRTLFGPRTSGLQSLVAVTGARRDSVMLDVSANNALASLAVSGMPDTVRAGDAFPSDVTVMAYDAYGNTITQFTGAVGFADDDPHPSATMPFTRMYAAADSGSYAFPRGSFRLVTTGYRHVTVSSGAVSVLCSVYVCPGVFSSMRIENAAGGTGWAVNDVTVSSLDTIPMYAATYDIYGNYRSDTTAVWSLQTGDLVPSAGHALPVTAARYVFHSLVINRSGHIRAHMASAPSVFDTTGLLRVVEDPTSIYILTDPTGSPGDAVTTWDMTADDTVTFYSVGFNTLGTNLGAYQTNWGSAQSSGTFSFAGTAAELTVAPSVPGSGTLRIYWNGGALTHTTGLITVRPGAVSRISINRGGPDDAPLADTALYAGDTLAARCAAYDAKGNFIADTAVTWSVTGSLDSACLDGGTFNTDIRFIGTDEYGAGFLVASFGPGGTLADSVRIQVGTLGVGNTGYRRGTVVPAGAAGVFYDLRGVRAYGIEPGVYLLDDGVKLRKVLVVE